MNSRELSEKLDSLATELESCLGGDKKDLEIVAEIAKELRTLSNQSYAPGNGMSWNDVKPKATNKTFTDKNGKKLPF